MTTPFKVRLVMNKKAASSTEKNINFSVTLEFPNTSHANEHDEASIEQRVVDNPPAPIHPHSLVSSTSEIQPRMVNRSGNTIIQHL